jgi:hypothetical protein
MVHRLIMVGPLVVAPLGLSLVSTPRRDGSHNLSYRLLPWLWPLGVAGLVGSLLLPRGALAAGLTAPWLLLTLLVALFGVWRFLPRGLAPLEELTLDAGLLYLPVGGVWMMASRAGHELMGFDLVIVTLTAAHFHFAGFAAPLITGLSGRSLGHRPGLALHAYRLAAASVILNPFLIAIGITISPLMEVISSFGLALGLLLMSMVMVLAVGPRLRNVLAWSLLSISGLSLTGTMVLACMYALGEFLGQSWVFIPKMAATHGAMNVFGFSLCGLLAWSVAEPGSRGRLPWPPFSRLKARGLRVGPDFFARHDAQEHPEQPPTGLVDDMDAYDRAAFDIEDVHPAVRAFYEHTARQRLFVRAHWQPGFRLGGRLFRWLASQVDQMGLPVADVADEEMASRILKVRDEVDGRQGVRAWVRTYSATGQVVYVAAYSLHTFQHIPYMNIAFPLPGGNITSVLRMDRITRGPGANSGGLVLSTLPDAEGVRGDEGIYAVTPWLPIRAPLDEAIYVWPRDPAQDGQSWPRGAQRAQVVARHDMWLFGKLFLTLDYYLVDEDA